MSLRLFIDEKKQKVVFAEAGKDFVDVLFSLLTLPMGTIVKLLEKHPIHSKTINIGCFNNLYKSVADMDVDNFETKACKELLLNPRSSSELKCQRLTLNVNPINHLSFFMCRKCNLCSNFSTSICKCCYSMDERLPLQEPKVSNGVFVSGNCSYIVTDELKVAVSSTDIILKTLKSQAYGEVTNLVERLVNIGINTVLTLLACMFSSNTPLTDTFLIKGKPEDSSKILNQFTKEIKKVNEEILEPEKVIITLRVLLRKKDMDVLYVECGQDFVDLLFTFLAVPLESILEISTFGCIRNLYQSFKDLRVSSNEKTPYKSVLHHYYKCKKQLLDINTEQPPVYYLEHHFGNAYLGKPYLTKDCNSAGPVVLLMDPKSSGSKQSPDGSGFVKRDSKFIVSDDLIIRPMNTSSTICFLNKLQIRPEDIEVQEIKITKTEATSLLRASLVTTSALNACLKDLVKTRKPEFGYTN